MLPAWEAHSWLFESHEVSDALDCDCMKHGDTQFDSLILGITHSAPFRLIAAIWLVRPPVRDDFIASLYIHTCDTAFDIGSPASPSAICLHWQPGEVKAARHRAALDFTHHKGLTPSLFCGVACYSSQYLDLCCSLERAGCAYFTLHEQTGCKD